MQKTHAIKLRVSGMTCEGCVKAVTRVIKRVDAEAAVSIELASGEVMTETSASKDVVIAAINNAGYEARAA